MNSYVYALCTVVCASLFAGCTPDESSSSGPGGGTSSASSSSASSSSGGNVPMTGKSPAIEAFQAARVAAREDQKEIDDINAQTATASNVDMSAEADGARVSYVLDWTIDDVEQAIGQMANINFERGGAPRTQEEAETTSAAFAANAAMVLSKLPEQPWDAEWATVRAEFLKAQSDVKRPIEWAGVADTATRGAMDGMKIIAIHGGAKTIGEAFASLGGIRAQLLKNENDAFRTLAAITAE